MGHVRQQRAERDHQLRADRLGQLDDQLRECAPAERGLAAGQQDQVAGRTRHAGLEELDGGPHDFPRIAIHERDPRPGGLEVIEVLGIDGREAPGFQRATDECDRRGRRVSSVVPALEPAHQGRGPQTVRSVLPAQWLHPIHRTSWGDAPRPLGHHLPEGWRPDRRSLRVHPQGSVDHQIGISVPGA